VIRCREKGFETCFCGVGTDQIQVFRHSSSIAIPEIQSHAAFDDPTIAFH